ncbi:hypothetical protein [Spirosoma pomorum]|jgi:hypothetical protein
MNILIIVTGYGSVKPIPWRRAYLNLDEEVAIQRFVSAYPHARDVSAASVRFDDELSIGANGAMSSSYSANTSI